MKKAIVIGATSGIGKGVALLLARNNYKVAITGRRTELLLNLQNEYPGNFIAKTMDVTKTSQALQVLDQLAAELQGIDLLIICSGTGELNDTLDIKIEQTTIDTNVTGFTAIAGWAFNFFQKQQHGHLAAVTSLAALRGGRQAPSYNATKSYQVSYLEALRQKSYYLKLPITVTDIRAGFVDTAMAKSSILFWVATVEKASGQIVHALNNKKEVVYVTRRWRLFAWLLKIMPAAIYKRL